MSKKFSFRGRANRGKGNTDLSRKLTAEKAEGMKTYQVWKDDEVIREIQANSFADALEASNGLWVTIKV